MPKLPDVTAFGARPTPTAAGGVVSYSPVTGAETARGEAIARLGGAVGGAGEKLHSYIKEQEQRANTVRVEDAFNRLREKQLDLTIGEQGFTKRKSGDAVNSPLMEEYGNLFTGSAKEIEDGLANDSQKELFRKRVAVSNLQFKQDILRHVTNENEAYAKQVFEGAQGIELQNVSARWKDPNAIGLSLERVNGMIAQEADRSGWAEEFTQAARTTASSKIHETVINQALGSGNLPYAKAWYDKHKDVLDAGINARIQAAFKKYQDDYERKVEKQINEVDALIKAGFPPSIEQLGPVVAAARGTRLEADARQMVTTANATGQFSKLPPAQQAVTLTRLEASVRGGPTKDNVTLLNSFRTIHESQQRALKESPVTFAVRQGFVDPNSPAALPLDLSKPETLGPALSERFDLARNMRVSHGTDFKPLTPEEATLLGDALKQSTAAQKSDYFGKLQQASGNDLEGYAAMMAQIAPDDPVTAIAGVASARGRTQASNLMLKGQEILRPQRKEDGSPDKGKLWPMPPEKDLREAFADYEGEAFAGHPKARSDSYQAALAIYAAKAAEEGDASGEIDNDRWEEAIKLATGGIERWNGRSTPMPYGQDKSEFKDNLYRRIDALADSGLLPAGVTASKLKDMPLEPVGDGRYIFRAGDGVLVKPKSLGLRPDGTEKGMGYLGAIRRPDGDVSTEISIGVELDGKEMEIPTLVPTLTKEEVSRLISMDHESDKIPDQIIEKAVAHARARIKAGKPVFATPEESPTPIPLEPIVIDFNINPAGTGRW